jgi:hypothetical protein
MSRPCPGRPPSVRGKRSFSPVIYSRVIVFKVNAMCPNQWGTSFFSDGQAVLVLYALNVGPSHCLRASVDESGLVGSEYGFAIPHIAQIVGSKSALFASPSLTVCSPLQVGVRKPHPSSDTPAGNHHG